MWPTMLYRMVALGYLRRHPKRDGQYTMTNALIAEGELVARLRAGRTAEFDRTPLLRQVS